MFIHRWATEADIPAISRLMDRAITELQRPFLTPGQLSASRGFMGLDTQLIADRSYVVIEEAGTIVGCGGWSYRSTLYGGDHSTELRDAATLVPGRDAARIRAMYVDPDQARRGIGRLILATCEAAAAAAGFDRVSLMATLSGEPLYLACGYLPVERRMTTLEGAEPVPVVEMTKRLSA